MTPSTSMALSLFVISSTTRFSAMPSTYTTLTAVDEYLPIVIFFTVSFGDFIRLRMRVTLVLISSMKPSLGPFKTFEVGGSTTARLSNFLRLKRLPFSSPSMKRTISPSATAGANPSFSRGFISSP